MKRKLVAGAAAVAAVAGGGAVVATAATPEENDAAILGDVAQELGVKESALESALQKAMTARIDAAVVAGELTSEQAAQLKERVAAGDVPLFAAPGRGHHGHGGSRYEAAAAYLGMTDAELREAVDEDTSLADVARERGKSVSGLVDALLPEARERVDAAFAAGRITEAQRDERIAGLRDRVTARVNGEKSAGRDAAASGFEGLAPTV
jgi:hypothetical protein